jgi:ribonuclease E
VAEAEAPKKRGRRKKAEAEPAGIDEVAAAEAPVEVTAEEQPRRGRRKKADAAGEVPVAAAQVAEVAAEAPAKPARGRRKKAEALAEVAAEAPAPVIAPEMAVAEADDGGDDDSPRRGWWQRTFGNE